MPPADVYKRQAQSNTLALTTGQSLRLTVKQVLDFQDLSSFTNALVDVCLLYTSLINSNLNFLGGSALVRSRLLLKQKRKQLRKRCTEAVQRV